MDIFEFALEKEATAEKTYRHLAGQAGPEGLRNIFTYLADMEHKHGQVVAAMREQASSVRLEEDSLDTTRTMLNKLALEKEAPLQDRMQQVEVYKQARQLEKESIELYSEQARLTENDEHRRVFNQLADQERMHYILIDNILEFVMQPEVWCEDAEFSHIIDKYRGTAFYPGMMEYDV